MKFIRSPIICLLAHVDHGKCVAPDTNIILSDGSISTAQEIFEKYSPKGKEIILEDGICVELDEQPALFSFDGQHMVSVGASHLWKRKASSLIKVKLSNGDEISTTREHPFLVFDDFKIGFKRADQLETTDAILGPSSYQIKENQSWKSRILEAMAKADCFIVFLDQERSLGFIKKIEASNKEDLKRRKLLTTSFESTRFRITDFVNLSRYFGFSLDDAYDWIIAFKNSTKKRRAGKTSRPMRLPSETQLYELGYILGVFAGDGSIKGVKLHNNDHEIQNAYVQHMQNIFGAKGKIQFGHTAWEVTTNGSKTLERLFTEVLCVCDSDKCATIRVPWICMNSFEAFRGFIEGWFDTDGYVSEINNCIEFTSKSKRVVRESSILLSGLGIHSSVYRKYIYWTLRITNRPFVEKFLEIFNPKLVRRVDSLRKIVHRTSSSRIYEKYSLSRGSRSKIKEAMGWGVNRKIGFFNKSIDYPELTGHFLRQIIQNVERPNETTVEIQSFFQKQLVGIGVTKIEAVENPHGWVYDFTIPNFHNFVAERVIVHNTSLLDAIRGTSVAKKEAGGITQMIGASYVSKADIDGIAKDLSKKMKLEMKIPGLLFIDTPGHEAFTNLRDRGGSIADLVILVVDVNQGFQPQTIESIMILKEHKTPFVIVANKIDAIDGWKSQKTTSFMESYNKQIDYVKERVDQKLYDIMGKISEYGFDSERYDRVADFGKSIAIIPVSAKTKEGLSELLVLIAGLSQKFLGTSLEIEEAGRGKGSILEVKEEIGLGTTLDVIVYDGIMSKNDEVAFLTKDGVRITRIRGLLLPSKSGKERFQTVDSVVAAAGVKINAPDLDGALPGSPIEVVRDKEADISEIESKFKSTIFEKQEQGIVLRADSLGSVEALLKLLGKEEIPVKDASVGSIARKDILSAGVVSAQDKYLGVVMGFNVKILDEAWEESKASGVPIISSDIIYRLVDNYRDWVKEEKERAKRESLAKFVWPGKIKILPGYVFRASKPAIFGVDVLGGRIKNKYRLMSKDGTVVGEIREIQREKEKVEEASVGDQLAISCEGMWVGKDVMEGDILYSYMTEDEMKRWDTQLSMLSENEKAVFAEIRQILKRYF